MKAVVLAGGRGRRLLPYTSVLPKPLMPLGNRSVLEIVIEQLNRSGFTDIVLSVGYLSHLIRAILEVGPKTPGVEITFVQESEALGTAAPLRLIDDLGDTFLAMNGDVITTMNMRELVDHHKKSGNLITIAAHQRIETIDFGILSLDGASDDEGRIRRVVGYDDKPDLTLDVSMGVYVIERRALDWIPDTYFDIPDLVSALLRDGEPVGAYVYDGNWLDIGREDDYSRALVESGEEDAYEPSASLLAELDPATSRTGGPSSWQQRHRS
jgi:NDP-mannose synthase